ncbi:hypothetical protein ABE237_16980 [Brevibacillus formosus]|uniref:hypothetical protein n=1 Tax=Brevibacillus TaxID=55080 RepID=UPI000D0FF6A3|nr:MULTISPECIES: hypothetical protein [Brevibacillus]MBG9944383.1 hypothetical protein [Brevibacillus formosus]MED1946268.1 hypothetical protein [Brevibacillus formosus]MED1998810.1 hypothetical protein [Brevibacillus formosus]MED2084133.1 hypothetical protein [Brevibacillus formosus]PSK18170.1 hypothetical protein C7R94_13430 [Brevibacillus sp. NRRL NRS-603]
MTDLSGATVTLEYNTLKKLESNEVVLNAIVQYISRSTTVEEGDWIDDDTVAPSTILIDMKALKPLLLKYCLTVRINTNFWSQANATSFLNTMSNLS